MDLATLIGSLGAATILIAFTMNQTHQWKDNDLIYDVFNFFGGVLLLISGIMIRGWPFVALNAIWSLVSLRDIVAYFKQHNC